MKIVSACAACMTPHIGRVAIQQALSQNTSLEDLKWRMHPAQACAIANLYVETAMINVSEVRSLEDFPEVQKLAKKYLPQTFLSLPIEQDAKMREDQIELRHKAIDLLLVVVQSLAVPIGFEVHR